jgi:uncharacterized protein YraI
MIGTRKLLAAVTVIAGLLLPAQAMAAYEAYTRVDLNLRVGPATNYGIIDVIPYGEPVTVIGCLDQYYWCDVEWYGLRGWVYAIYLVRPGTSVYLPQWAPTVGLPVITFSFFTYHDRYYRDRPWYRKRTGHWRGRDWRDERPRERREVEQPRKRQEIEQPRQRQETQKPRKSQQTEQPRKTQQKEQPRKSQQTEQPRKSQQKEQPRKSQQKEQQSKSQQTKQQSKRVEELRKRSGTQTQEEQQRGQ